MQVYTCINNEKRFITTLGIQLTDVYPHDSVEQTLILFSHILSRSELLVIHTYNIHLQQWHDRFFF